MKAPGSVQTYIPNLSPTRRNSVARPRNVRSVRSSILGTVRYYQDQVLLSGTAGTGELELN